MCRPASDNLSVTITTTLHLLSTTNDGFLLPTLFLSFLSASARQQLLRSQNKLHCTLPASKLKTFARQQTVATATAARSLSSCATLQASSLAPMIGHQPVSNANTEEDLLFGNFCLFCGNDSLPEQAYCSSICELQVCTSLKRLK